MSEHFMGKSSEWIQSAGRQHGKRYPPTALGLRKMIQDERHGRIRVNVSAGESAWFTAFCESLRGLMV